MAGSIGKGAPGIDVSGRTDIECLKYDVRVTGDEPPGGEPTLTKTSLILAIAMFCSVPAQAQTCSRDSLKAIASDYFIERHCRRH